jgi:HEAT repeat protein
MMSSDARIKGLLVELRGRYTIPRKRAADALVQIGEASVPGLTEALNNKSVEVQQSAADALQRIGSHEALAAVQQWKQRTGA